LAITCCYAQLVTHIPNISAISIKGTYYYKNFKGSKPFS
jgi:hypothetical protein